MNEMKIKSAEYEDWYKTLDLRKFFIGNIPVNSLATHYVTVTYKENYVKESETPENSD